MPIKGVMEPRDAMVANQYSMRFQLMLFMLNMIAYSELGVMKKRWVGKNNYMVRPARIEAMRDTACPAKSIILKSTPCSV